MSVEGNAMKFIITVEVKEVPEGIDALTQGTQKQLAQIEIVTTEDLKAINKFQMSLLKKKALMEVMDWLAHNV